jgi:integrase
VLRAVPDDALGAGAVERPLYLTAAMTGLRQGELLALRWSDVDWTASRVRVAESFTRGAFDSPKSHRERSVPMADRLAGELERHFQRSYWRSDQDLVFAHPATGHVLDASKLRKRFRTALVRAGARSDVPRAAPHVRNPDGRGRRAAARDPGVDGARRREHDRDLRALCARPDRRCGVCATCVRLGHGRAGPARRCGFGDAAPRQAPVTRASTHAGPLGLPQR